MPELNKEQLSENINNVLGLDLDFTKMTKKDLSALYSALAKQELNPDSQSGDLLRRPLKEIFNQKVLNKDLGDLTLLEVLQQIFPVFQRRGGGIFGFGLLPFEIPKKRST